MKKGIGVGLTLGYVTVMAFQVYAFHYYLGVALESYWLYRRDCKEPRAEAPSSLSMSLSSPAATSLSPTASYFRLPQTSSSTPRPLPSTSATHPLASVFDNPSRSATDDVYEVYSNGALEGYPSPEKDGNRTLGAKSRKNGPGEEGNRSKYKFDMENSSFIKSNWLKGDAATATSSLDSSNKSSNRSRMNVSNGNTGYHSSFTGYDNSNSFEGYDNSKGANEVESNDIKGLSGSNDTKRGDTNAIREVVTEKYSNITMSKECSNCNSRKEDDSNDTAEVNYGTSTKRRATRNSLKGITNSSSTRAGGSSISSSKNVTIESLLMRNIRINTDITGTIRDATTSLASHLGNKEARGENTDVGTAISGHSSYVKAANPEDIIATSSWNNTSGRSTISKGEDVTLTGAHTENSSTAERSSRSTPISPLHVGREIGQDECKPELGFVFPKLALVAQFVTALGLGIAAYLAWMVAVQDQGSLLYHLSIVALVTAVVGFLSIVSWSEGMASGKFEHQWQFWPYAFSYVYVVLAVIPMLATQATSSGRRPVEFRMTEAQWLRWQRVQERRRQVDDLLEAAGGGDVIYNPASDGSYRVCRWDSSGDEGQAEAPQPQTTTIIADVESAAAPGPGDASAEPTSISRSPASTTGGMGTNHVLLVIPRIAVPRASATTVGPIGARQAGKCEVEPPWTRIAEDRKTTTTTTPSGTAAGDETESRVADTDDGPPSTTQRQSRVPSAATEEKSCTLALSEEEGACASPGQGELVHVAVPPPSESGQGELVPTGLTVTHPAEADVEEQEQENEKMGQTVSSESSPLLSAEERAAAAASGGKRSKYGGT